MSGIKRSRDGDPPKSPVSNMGSSIKKRCITDFFTPKPKSVNQPTDNTTISSPVASKSQANHEADPQQQSSRIISNDSPPKTPQLSTRAPLTPRLTTPNLSSLHVTTPRAVTPNVWNPRISVPIVSTPPVTKNRPATTTLSTPTTNNNNANQADENHLHLSFKFLYPENRRDIKKRRPDDPDYDARTLHVPESFLDSQTPALRQWWTIKQRNMDAVLFFKMGKFYELFNEDAVIGVNQLDINYMGKADDTKPAHAGFPEISYEKYSRMLIDKGYKVLRVEQTETPAMMEERCQQTGRRGKFDKVVNREVCRVTTKGTQMLGVTESVFHSAHNQYLLAIRESDGHQYGDNFKVFGVCFVDVTISKLYIGQFEDDNNYSMLNMLLSHNKPTEVLYERSNISKDTYQAILRTGALLSPLQGQREFWPIRKALSHIKGNSIFLNEFGNFEWPSFLANLFDGDSSENLLSLEPKAEFQEGLHAFGAIVYYLHSQLIANQVLSCTTFELYRPPTRHDLAEKSKKNGTLIMPSMILDHIALKNLEVFENSEGGTLATLYESINNCKTHFGQRLLRNWVCSPLCDIAQINNRLDAVEALMSNSNASLMNEICHTLGPIPDLERLLSKIKSQCFKSEGDARAIMFDGQQFSKAKIGSFMDLLKNFKNLRKFIESMKYSAKKCQSQTLKKLLTLTSDPDGDGLFPDYEAELKYFDEAFDHDQARKTGKIIPAPGVDADYDRCNREMNNINKKLDDYLEEQKRILGTSLIEYFGTAKNRFQIQVPEVYCRKVPDHYRIETTRKGFKRYYTTDIDRMFQKLTLVEEEMKKVLDNIMSTIFAQFSRKMSIWSAAIECIALLDVLQSIASFVRSLKARNIDVCRPVLSSSEEPIIEYKDGRHPALVKTNPNFISNDLKLDQKLILLTGANMGGKSTMMRQTALLTILAQMGCFVPASKMVLTPVDRIFSRLGASDRLLEGESTFYTELVETSSMLRYGTKDSLLLLDELGRGTSTYDGTAIAYSVANEITQNLKSRCLFSTHYHCLVQDFANNPKIRLAHMGCKIEKNYDVDTQVDIEPLKESITFLYKISDGPVARSYGFNVAKLAGIADDTIGVAYKKSKELELSCKILEALQKFCRNPGNNFADNRDALKMKVLAEIQTTS